MFEDLSNDDRVQLISLSANNGWLALRGLMERVIKQALADCLLVDPANSAEVLAKHATARAMSQFYTRIIKLMEFEIQEHIDAVKDAAWRRELENMSPDDLLRLM